MVSNNIICHLTSVHSRYDTRIFLKECKSLVKASHDVFLIVADGKGNETIDGVTIFDVGKPKNRIQRMLFSTKKVFKKAKSINAAIYHIHDPELIPAGIKLMKRGTKVIFDAHEDLPMQLLSKPYLNNTLGKILSKLFSYYERKSCKKFDAIVTATLFIRDKFLKINLNTIDINNYPMINELYTNGNNTIKKNQVCYIGGLNKIRGMNEIFKAIKKTTSNVKIIIGGNIESLSLHPNDKIETLGFIDRKEVGKVLSDSIAGLVTFLPFPNHINSQPNKMFEYMSAGLPIICSNFPLWKQIVEDNNCGVCVDPLNSQEIADSIDFFTNNPITAQEMGKNGRKAVEKQYNWELEEKKLLKLYSEI
jgi:glycosyltransferase involved in cell wall biosynthesis